MSDVWSEVMHQASFGGLSFDCLTARDSIRRALVRHTYPRKRGADLVPMGDDARETRCRVVFFERPTQEGDTDEGTHVERFERFVALLRRDEPQDFVHPLTGSYRALADGVDFDVLGDARDEIELDVIFIEDSTAPSPFDFGASRPVQAGVAAVEAEAAALDAALADAGLESDVGGSAVGTISGWSTDLGLTARQVNLELQALSNRISRTVDELELSTDLRKQPIWRSLQRLHFEVRRAAEAFRQTQPTIFEFEVRSPIPLRVLCADLYGARESEQRYAEIMRLNDIEDPSLIPAGTVLAANAPGERQPGLRSAA